MMKNAESLAAVHTHTHVHFTNEKALVAFLRPEEQDKTSKVTHT